MAIPYNLVSNEAGGSLTAKINGKLYIAESTHVNWSKLVSGVTLADDSTDLDALARLFDPGEAVQDYFTKVSERVSVANGHVYFDGEEINDGLSNHILRLMEDGDDDGAKALVNFMENIMTNPNEHSRTQLFDWLSRRDFTITPKGTFLAYKGVRPRRNNKDGEHLAIDTTQNYPYESISTGTAIVDGVVYSGAIPNGVGAVVEMPRGQVAHDPNVACHTGLHAGNYRYASSFAQGALLTVEINPRDVVSVPHDSNSEKIRCCRYTVLEVNKQEYTTAYYDGFEVDEDDLDEDYSYDAPYYSDDEDDDGF